MVTARHGQIRRFRHRQQQEAAARRRRRHTGTDLVRTNALKTVCTAVLSGVALVVFAFRGQVWWIPGLVLAVGSIIGAALSVRFAINVSQNTLKWILFVMVAITCASALLF